MYKKIKICGEVIHGNKKGRIIGYPTANIALSEKQCEAMQEGTYSGTVKRKEKTYKGAIFISHSKNLLEVHILDFDQKIYGQEICIEITRRIRDNKKFLSVNDLKMQITKDIESIRKEDGNSTL